MNKTQALKLKHTKLKAFMMRFHNYQVDLTADEVNILNSGKGQIPIDEITNMLMQMRVKDHIQVSEVVKNCCRYSLMFFEINSKSSSDDVIDKIFELDKHYKRFLQYIKPITVVTDQVAFNSKLQ